MEVYTYNPSTQEAGVDSKFEAVLHCETQSAKQKRPKLWIEVQKF